MAIRHRITIAAIALIAITSAHAQSTDNGVQRVRSAYSIEESIARVKADIAAKGITFFNEVDRQAPRHQQP